MDRQPVIVLDTHALVWWASGSDELSPKAKSAIQQAARRDSVIVSAISLFEIRTAVRRGRLEFSLGIDEWLDALKQLKELSVHPVTELVARVAGGYDHSMPGDPADRMIAATADILEAPLVTADRTLRACGRITTVW